MAVATMIVTPLARIARARKAALVLIPQQEPIWLTGDSIGLSSRGAAWPEGAEWWFQARTVFVFPQHLAVRFSLDALSLETVWEDSLWVDVVLVAQIGHGFAFNQMPAKNRDFLLRAKITSVVVVHRGMFF